jgi:peptide/nickel transport system permease protein
MSAYAYLGRRVASARGIARLDATTYVCLGILGLLTVTAVFAPLLVPQDPIAVNPLLTNEGPSAGHLLGTDGTGRDLFSRLIMGTRTSLVGPLLVVLIATALGSGLAIMAAWVGGWFDQAISRCVDAMFAFPGVLVAILAVAVFGRGMTAPIIALGVAYIPYLARITRAAAVRERELPYVEALQTQGLSAFRICLRHLLPNLTPLIVAQMSTAFGYAMVDLATIAFLGLGVQPPTPDWGVMVASGRTAILEGKPQESLFAGMMIVIAVMAFNILGARLSARAGGRR